MAELALGGWLVTYQNKCPAPGIEPGYEHSTIYYQFSVALYVVTCVMCLLVVDQSDELKLSCC